VWDSVKSFLAKMKKKSRQVKKVGFCLAWEVRRPDGLSGNILEMENKKKKKKSGADGLQRASSTWRNNAGGLIRVGEGEGEK